MIKTILFWVSWIPIAIGLGLHIRAIIYPRLQMREAFEIIQHMIRTGELGIGILDAPTIFTTGLENTAEEIAPTIVELLPDTPSVEQIAQKVWEWGVGGQRISVSLRIAEMFAYPVSLRYRMIKFPSIWIIAGVLIMGLWWLALLLIVYKGILYLLIARRLIILYFLRSITLLIAEEIHKRIASRGHGSN